MQSQPLFGRRKITISPVKITKDNVAKIVEKAMTIHKLNSFEIDFLYGYYCGKQPILGRTKTVRPEICNRAAVNHAYEFVSFHTGYSLAEPCAYVSNKNNKAVTSKVGKANEFMRIAGREKSDKHIFNWLNVGGTATRALFPSENPKDPFLLYDLDPRNSFVVYGNDIGETPLAGVKYVKDENGGLVYSVYTDDAYFQIENNKVSEEENKLGAIPIFSYTSDFNRQGVFEPAIPLLDALNNILSNRLDGIEQFVQAFYKFTNCDIDEEQFRALKELGAIKVKSIDGNKADVDIVAQELDQAQAQTLVDYITRQAYNISAVPITSGGDVSTSDNAGAVLYRSGWALTDTRAQNMEDMYKGDNRRFDKLMADIMKRVCGIELDVNDFQTKFMRHATDNLISRTQAAMNMKELGYCPELAFSQSGLSSDPIGDIEKSEPYIKAKWTTEVNSNGLQKEEKAKGEVVDADTGGT